MEHFQVLLMTLMSWSWIKNAAVYYFLFFFVCFKTVLTWHNLDIFVKFGHYIRYIPSLYSLAINSCHFIVCSVTIFGVLMLCCLLTKNPTFKHVLIGCDCVVQPVFCISCSRFILDKFFLNKNVTGTTFFEHWSGKIITDPFSPLIS